MHTGRSLHSSSPFRLLASLLSPRQAAVIRPCRAPPPPLQLLHSPREELDVMTSAAPPAPSKFLARLREQYEQGKFCDACVRCVVMPEQQQGQEHEEEQEEEEEQTTGGRKTRKRSAMSAEPSRRSRRRGSNTLQEREEKKGPATTDILCHANILCARSPYFESSLGGDWNEAQTKVVEVVLEDEQAVDDMKLLIKLCYSGSYTKDGEELIDRSTRMRLAFLGNAFEMQECVSECLSSLAEGLTAEDALTILDEVPEELRGHEEMPGVIEKMIAVLADAIDKWTPSDPPTAGEKERKIDIVNALAKALGPVDRFFGKGKWREFRDSSFYTCLPFKPHVLALSPTVMKAVLSSDALHVTTENEVYTLFGCWIYQSPLAGGYDGIHAVAVADCLPLFRRLVKLVRLQARFTT